MAHPGRKLTLAPPSIFACCSNRKEAPGFVDKLPAWVAMGSVKASLTLTVLRTGSTQGPAKAPAPILPPATGEAGVLDKGSWNITTGTLHKFSSALSPGKDRAIYQSDRRLEKRICRLLRNAGRRLWINSDSCSLKTLPSLEKSTVWVLSFKMGAAVIDEASRADFSYREAASVRACRTFPQALDVWTDLPQPAPIAPGAALRLFR